MHPIWQLSRAHWRPCLRTALHLCQAASTLSLTTSRSRLAASLPHWLPSPRSRFLFVSVATRPLSTCNGHHNSFTLRMQSILQMPHLVSSLQMVVHTLQSTPDGPPPVLVLGGEDIFWVNQLQVRSSPFRFSHPLLLQRSCTPCGSFSSNLSSSQRCGPHQFVLP